MTFVSELKSLVRWRFDRSDSSLNFRMYFTKFNRRSVLVHLLFWAIYFVTNAYLWQTFDKTYNETTFYGLTRLPVKIIAVYINFYLLIRFFFRKKYVVYFTLSLSTLFLAGLVQTYISSSGGLNYQNLTQFTLPVCSVVVLSSALVIVNQFLVKVNESKQLEIDKVKTELSFLKTQLQPHFLFNTLNNIYSLTLENSNLAGKSILQLSSLLRYVVYESEEERVDLQREIDHLKDYIALEQIRFGTKLELSFNISGIVFGKKIVPVLLMPLLENAFKHASNRINEIVWITIDLIIKESSLYFTLENSVFSEGKTQARNALSGIGLENTKKRLSLLYETYTLESEQRDNYYHTFLMVPLN